MDRETALGIWEALIGNPEGLEDDIVEFAWAIETYCKGKE